MQSTLIAEAATTVAAPREKVWDALVTPAAIKQYMFGTNVTSDWTSGSSIVWEGEWQGKAYRDTGTILRIEMPNVLQYSHYSPLTGKLDTPENHHTVTIRLSDEGKATRVALSQDNNATEEEREHSQKNWEQMLAGLKKYVER